MVRASSNTVGLRTHTSFLGETVLIGTIFPCDEDDPDFCDGAGRKTLSLPEDFFVDVLVYFFVSDVSLDSFLKDFFFTTGAGISSKSSSNSSS